MIIDVTEDELEAVRKWNFGIIKRRQNRRLLCKTFNSWKNSFLEIIDGKCSQIQNEIDQKNTSIQGLQTTSHINGPQSISQLRDSNQQLMRELEALQREQQELEMATDTLRNTLKNLQTPTSSYSSRTSSFFSNSGRLPSSSIRTTSYSRYQPF